MTSKARIVRPTESNDEDSTSPYEPDTSSLPENLIDCVERQAALILKTAPAKFAPVLELLAQTAPELSTPEDAKPTSEELQRVEAGVDAIQLKSQVAEKTEENAYSISDAQEPTEAGEPKRCRKRKSEGDEEYIAKKRELAIREKALQLKEDVFEKKVATLQVKMEEFEKKFVHLDKRVDEIEENNITGYLEAKMNEMEERLEMIEVKKEEHDDIEIV